MVARRFALIVLLSILALVGGKFGCRAISRQERETRLETIESGLDRASAGLDSVLRRKLLAALKQARAQLARGELSPIALDTLRQRYEATMADDQLTPREVSHILALLADFPHWQDEVHALKYMGQR